VLAGFEIDCVRIFTMVEKSQPQMSLNFLFLFMPYPCRAKWAAGISTLSAESRCAI
jgi:hypothetical protein